MINSFLFFLISHLRLHPLLLLGSTVPYLLHPHPPICRLSQSRRVKFGSSHLIVTLPANWGILNIQLESLLNSGPQGLFCLWLPAWHPADAFVDPDSCTCNHFWSFLYLAPHSHMLSLYFSGVPGSWGISSSHCILCQNHLVPVKLHRS